MEDEEFCLDGRKPRGLKTIQQEEERKIFLS